MPFDDVAADHEPCASIGRAGFWPCQLHDVPYDDQLDDGNVRPQHDRVYADQWACQCGLRNVPHQQQLQLDDRADRLREFGMPFDDLAAHHESCASNGRSVIWNCELLNVPFDSQLDDGDIRSQHDRVYADQWACQRGLRIVPHEQQL
jgi:hypothetical protein